MSWSSCAAQLRAWGVREEREGAGGAALFGGWDGGTTCGAQRLVKRGIFNAISILFSLKFLSLIQMILNKLLYSYKTKSHKIKHNT